ncbi:MaoC/PaaZ C-terminal domain-containing protein [Kerstersia gyiorum]|jgi:acyl dehydratase|uniref:MaoC/PaaZ C-terminal domain-containing protein n=1 Tax=Kerstersia gyiorum TaxID=206506 RepID=UPI00242E750D|nr:MaoC/PaaZ C-terminal domain-containing protein [Kerstersia gyiorum]MCH4272063.1 oxidoreductase [Kerstersia gyiorum]MCI1228484.1 oxidoreductase [Kerstersia gyiorum]
MPPATDLATVVHPFVLTQQDFNRFADLSGDHNPIHVDPVFSARTPFGGTVSHGMLLFSRLRGLLARHYPGLALANQTLMFAAPCYADEPLILALTPAPGPDGADIALQAEVRKADGRLGLSGTCTLRAAADANAAPALPANSSTPLQAPPPLPSSAAPAAGLSRYLDLRPGDRASLERCYTQADIANWTALADYPGLPATLPEPLIPALFSCLLGEELPGHGTNYLKQSLQFLAPARACELLTASVEISRLRADKALVNLRTRCTGANGRLLCHGEALVLFRQ